MGRSWNILTTQPIAEYAGTRCEGFFKIGKERWHPKWCKTEMEQINYHFRQNGEHRFAYDFVTLVQALSDAGFQEIKRRDFDPGLDSADRELGTLYVNAFKPATGKQLSERDVKHVLKQDAARVAGQSRNLSKNSL